MKMGRLAAHFHAISIEGIKRIIAVLPMKDDISECEPC